jgi:alkanesulfonate monooxygenase SsuD/methylene tetrahydromethanopterin reductase-like flavin-dependent oxidoreductase (luciferase family)
MASGTILWMADERALGEHVVPRITKAAADAGRPAPRVVVGVPMVLCADAEVDAARDWANRVLGQAEYSPNYQRMLARGAAATMGHILAAGNERAVLDRIRAFRDAGATDFAVRVLPFGSDRDARIASRDRTLAFAASLCPAL